MNEESENREFIANIEKLLKENNINVEACTLGGAKNNTAKNNTANTIKKILSYSAAVFGLASGERVNGTGRGTALRWSWRIRRTSAMVWGNSQAPCGPATQALTGS